jgi:hypothetical protein
MFDAKSYIHNKEMNNGLESRDLYPSTIKGTTKNLKFEVKVTRERSSKGTVERRRPMKRISNRGAKRRSCCL